LLTLIVFDCTIQMSAKPIYSSSPNMKLYKQKSGKSWCMRFIFDGQRIDRSTGFSNLRKAEAYAEAFRTQLRNGEVGLITKIETPLFKTAEADFLVWAESRLEKSTVRRYRIATVALINAFGNVKVNKITSADIEKFVTKRSRETGLRRGVKPKAGRVKAASVKKLISSSSINKELAVLKKIFNNLIIGKVISVNPVKPVKFLKESNEAGRVLNYEEEKLYLLAASQPYQDFAAILIETGLRPDELCNLTIQDVNLDEEYLFIKKGKTKAARRLVPLSDRALKIVKAKMEKAEGVYLFAGGRGANHYRRSCFKV
jgi:integrase